MNGKVAEYYENLRVKFVFNDVETIISNYDTQDDGKLVFEFADVAPQWFNDTIYATIYGELDGVTVESEEQEYSVATYCYNTLNNRADDTEVRTLMVDLLNYGAAAQSYANYKTDNLVNKQLTEEQKTWGTATLPQELTSVTNKAFEEIDNPTVNWIGCALRLENSVTVRYKIQAENVANLKMKIKVNDIEYIIPSNEFVAIDSGYYHVYFDGLNAAQMSVPIYATVYYDDTDDDTDDGTMVSNTLCYSIESYVVAKQNDTNTKLVEMLDAMIKYGYATFNYAN